MNTKDYLEKSHPQLADMSIKICYLCSQDLSDESTPDHIIPNSMFQKGDPSRPKLPVHHTCNNAKSKDDEWCANFLRFFAAFNPTASQELEKTMNRALDEKPYAFLIGHKNRNLKLAMSLFGDLKPGLQLSHSGQPRYQFHVPSEYSERANKWTKQMCRGLFMRNVPGANPPEPRLIWDQHERSVMLGKRGHFMQSVQPLIDGSGATSFGQEWTGRISYTGSRVVESPDKGFLFIHFYGEVGILATFGVEQTS